MIVDQRCCCLAVVGQNTGVDPCAAYALRARSAGLNDFPDGSYRELTLRIIYALKTALRRSGDIGGLIV